MICIIINTATEEFCSSECNYNSRSNTKRSKEKAKPYTNYKNL